MVNVEDVSCSFDAPVVTHLRDDAPCFTVLAILERLIVPADDGTTWKQLNCAELSKSNGWLDWQVEGVWAESRRIQDWRQWVPLTLCPFYFRAGSRNVLKGDPNFHLVNNINAVSRIITSISLPWWQLHVNPRRWLIIPSLPIWTFHFTGSTEFQLWNIQLFFARLTSISRSRLCKRALIGESPEGYSADIPILRFACNSLQARLHGF